MLFRETMQRIASNVERSREYFNPSAESTPLLGVHPTAQSAVNKRKGIAKKFLRGMEKAISTGSSAAERTGALATASPITVPLTLVGNVVKVRRWARARHHALQLGVYWEAANASDSNAKEETADAIGFAAIQKQKSQDRNGMKSVLPNYEQLVKLSHRFKSDRGDMRAHYARILRTNASAGDEWAQLAVAELVGLQRYQDAIDPNDRTGKGLDLIKSKLKS